MKVEDVKVGIKVEIKSTDCVNKHFNGWKGKVVEIVNDDEGDLMGINIIVHFGKGVGFNVFSAADLSAI
ncbi:hypothetical protein D3C80_1936960 [compost metagenome]